MTQKKDLKRRIRDRQQRTGESYVAARRAVLAEATPAEAPAPTAAAPGGIEVVEMDDVTDEAAQLGFKCTVSITRVLAEQVEPREVLERLRDVLLGTTADPAMESLRAVALRGEPARTPRLRAGWIREMQAFIARVRVGIGGMSEGGTMLAMPLVGTRGLVMMVCHLGFGIAMPKVRPRLVLTTADAGGFFMEPISVRFSRAP